MEEKYGKKLYKLNTLPMVYMPEVFLVVALIVVFGALLSTNINNGTIITAPLVIVFVILVAVLVLTIPSLPTPAWRSMRTPSAFSP